MDCPKCGSTDQMGTKCGACGAILARHSPTFFENSDDVVVGSTRIVLGSAPDCDVVLDDPTISAHHLAISTGSRPGLLVLEDLNSTNGTWVAGRRISRQEVSSREPVQLGRIPVDLARFTGTLSLSLLPVEDPSTLVVGRVNPADILVPYPMVSGRHLEIRLRAGSLELVDLGSANGTYLDGERVEGWVQVGAAEVLQLGSYRVPSSTIGHWIEALSAPSQSAHQIAIPTNGKLTIGRDPASDICIDLPQVSWNHAEIESKDGDWTIVDLGSSNGTWVDGRRVKKRSPITLTNRVSLGSAPLDLSEGRVQISKSYQGEVRLDAKGITRQLTKGPAAGKVILDDVSVSIYPGELVALMGPSGAGKTTLLEMLTGDNRPSKGQVLFNGDVLHDHPALLDRIGYVPQEDTMHRDLTVFEVLYYAAKMRLPSDLPNKAVTLQVDQLITKMGLAHIKNSLIGDEATRGISGGQRKRVNIALALITEPPLLFLDEPTSGLDATATIEVIGVLADLANDGKTIIMTIHQPRIEAFKKVDKLLLLAKGGKLAYFGPAMPGASAYFQARSERAFRPNSNPADYAIDVLEDRDPDEWKSDYLKSSAYQTWVLARQKGDEGVVLTASSAKSAAARGGVSQYFTMLGRYTKRKIRDRMGLGIQLLQPFIIGMLLVLLFGGFGTGNSPELPSSEQTLEEWFCLTNPGEEIDGKDDERCFHVDALEGQIDPETGEKIEQMHEDMDPMEPHPAFSRGVHATLFLLAAAAFWLGCSNVARELVSERPIYRRERRSGLNIPSYLASVFTFQILWALLQTVVMVLLVWLAATMSGDSVQTTTFFSSWVLLVITAGSGVALGLAVSAMAKNEVTAISVIPILLLPQLMLAGYLKIFNQMGDVLQFITAFVPLRWAFNGLARLEYNVWRDDLDGPSRDLAPTLRQVFGFDSDATPMMCGLALLLMSMLFLFFAYWRLLKTPSHSGN